MIGKAARAASVAAVAGGAEDGGLTSTVWGESLLLAGLPLLQAAWAEAKDRISRTLGNVMSRKCMRKATGRVSCERPNCARYRSTRSP